MKNNYFLILLLIIFGCNDEATIGPSIAEKGFVKLFTGPTADTGEVIKVLSDGFIIMGNAEGITSTKTKLIRLDKNGNTMWSQEFGFEEDDLIGKSMDVFENESGYIIIGDRINETTGSTSMYLFKVDNNGGNFVGFDISDEEKNGTGNTLGVDVLVNGTTNIITLSEMITTSGKVTLIAQRNISDLQATCSVNNKLDNISLVKSLFYNSDEGEFYYGGKKTKDNQIISNIVGYNYPCSTSPITAFVDVFPTTNDLDANQIIQSKNNFVAVGTTENDNIFITTVDYGGNPITTKEFSDEFKGEEQGLSLCGTSDGGFLIVGSTRLTSGTADEIGNEVDLLMVKTDGFGNMLWSKKFGNTNEEYGVYVQQTSDGGYAILANVEYGGIDMMALIKTDSQGNLD